MNKAFGLKWAVVMAGAMLLVLAAACGETTVKEVPVDRIVTKEVVKEVVVEVEKVVEVDSALAGEDVLPGYWAYPNSGSPVFSWFFSSDGSFELAGKKTTKNKVGYWVDKGEGKVKLLYNNGDERLRQSILLSINGNAASMQTTG